MEARKITIVSTKNQKKSVIMSSAETLGELKQDLTSAGIDFEDMTFYEGTSKTELMTDSSYLPKDVPYTNRTTGETTITNELVFMLTNTNKKIKSGSYRTNLYSQIKEKGLQQACIDKFGKNYTQCSNHDLDALLLDVVSASAPSNTCSCEPFSVDIEAREAIDVLAKALYSNKVIDKETYTKTTRFLSKKNIESPYSDDEIDKMFFDIL